MDSGQWTEEPSERSRRVDSCFVKEIKPFLLWTRGSIHEVIYVLTAVAIAINYTIAAPRLSQNGLIKIRQARRERGSTI